jgi:hypothetical protein
MTPSDQRPIEGMTITAQTAGRFGEHTVQAELERRGWNTCNLNADHPNAPVYDILAWKEAAIINIRVRPPQPQPGQEMPVFNVAKGKPPSAEGISATDFTVLVFMGVEHAADQFYVMRTRILRQTMAAHWAFYYSTPTNKGPPKVDNGQLTLHMGSAPRGEDRPGWNLAEKWADYRSAWHLLKGS